VNGNRRMRRLRVVAGSESLISSAGGALLIETAAAVGLDQALSEGLRPWRGRRAVHDPGKVLVDLAVAVALGGDCLADVAVVRAQPDLFGDVASDPTVSRLVAVLAIDAPAALAAVRQARAQARERLWQLSPPVGTDGPIVVDLDATIVLAHSEKEGATPTWKRTFGFHPLLAFLDHGPGELVSSSPVCCGWARRRPTTPPTTSACLPTRSPSSQPSSGPGCWSGVTAAPASTPSSTTCTNSGCTTGSGSTPTSRSLMRSVSCPGKHGAPPWTVMVSPERARRSPNSPATSGPRATPGHPGMRVMARRERPHPGAQLRLTDADGWRITLFATNVKGGRIADHELLHRRRARCEDRIRCAKDTGLRNLQSFAANQLWLEIVALAGDLLAWTQHLALTDTPARTWEPKRLRLRLLNIAGRVITSARQRSLRLPRGWPWNDPLLAGHARLHTLTT